MKVGVAPLPHFKTLYLHFDADKVNMKIELPSYREFGRLHFTKAELAELAAKEEREKIKMAFTMIDPSTLPVTTAGKTATEPKIGISASGQIIFNKFIQKAWEGCDRLTILVDKDTNRLGFVAMKVGVVNPKVTNYFRLVVTKADKNGKGGGEMSTPASSLLKTQLNYDYKSSGNQVYPAEFNAKLNAFILAVPKETPAPRPVLHRKKKDTNVATANGVNGAVVPVNTAPPSEDELLLVE